MRHKRWLNIAFVQFLIVAAIGLMMRAVPVGFPLPLQYRHWLHAHSHIGFLGWTTIAIGVALVRQFVPPERDPLYRKIFILAEISILGMLVSFPLQGYGLYSISFSTLFLIASYWFTVVFYSDLKRLAAKKTSVKLAKASLFYLVISSFGPWALGPVRVLGYADTPLFKLTIYYYLHFLYNGFIIIALLALAFRYLEEKLKISNDRDSLRIYRLMHYPVIPAYALSTLWVHPPAWIYGVAILAAVAQLAGFVLLIPYGKKLLAAISPGLAQKLMWVAGVSFGIKLALQLFSGLPGMEFIFHERNWVIGYIHLVTLGVISSFLLAWFHGKRDGALFQRPAFWAFIGGFLASELLLFAEPVWRKLTGSGLPYFYECLFAASVVMVVGLVTLGSMLIYSNPVASAGTAKQ